MKRSVSLPSRSFRAWPLGLAFAASLTALAPATIVISTTENHDGVGSPANNPEIPLTVSATDLVNVGQPSLGSMSFSGFTPYTTSTPNALNDGSNGGWNLDASTTAVTTQSTPWSLTFTLANTVAGYTITGINVMSLWSNDFVNQNYTVEISTFTVPAFTALGGPITAFTATTPTSGQAGSSLMSSVTDSSGVLATGVLAIRFTFSPINGPTSGATLAAYREVDVIGTATPEPGTWSLALLAAGACALRRRRA